MKFQQFGDVWVPQRIADASRRPVVAGGMETLYDQTLEEIKKSIFGGQKPQSVPHQILPWAHRLGLYKGIKEPIQATRSTQDFMERMAATPIIRAIHSGFVMEAMAYCRPARSPHDKGFTIYKRNEAEEPTDKDRRRMDAISGLLCECSLLTLRKEDGALGRWNGDQTRQAEPLPTFISQLFHDSLTYDWACIEVEEGTAPRICPTAWFKAADATRIRMTEQKPRTPVRDIAGQVIEAGYEPEFRKDIRVEFVELDEQQKVINEYTWAEMVPIVRNKRTKFSHAGYGWPELASLVEIVAGMVTAIDHNVSYFTTSLIPPGLVVATGDWNQEALNDFLYQMVRPNVMGDQLNRLPMLFGEAEAKATYTPFRQAEKQDMFWKNWLSFLTALSCAVYHMAPEDINFQSFLTVGGLQTGTGGEQRVLQQRSKGFIAPMMHFEGIIDRRFVRRFFADKTGMGPYGFRWSNLHQRDQDKEREWERQDLESGLSTVNDVLARRDERPIRDPRDRKRYFRFDRWIRDNMPEIAAQPQKRQQLVERTYEDDDGLWCLWPDAPVNAGLQQLWREEHEKDMPQEEEPSEDDNWQAAQDGGPPAGWSERVDMESWKAAQGREKEEQKQEQERPEYQEEREKKEPGARGQYLAERQQKSASASAGRWKLGTALREAISKRPPPERQREVGRIRRLGRRVIEVFLPHYWRERR